MPDGRSRSPSPNLDTLRSIAVLMVLFDHLNRQYHVDRFDNIGFFGVLLFFVHTALVLMYSMQRSHLTGLALVKDFYVRRFFRIYPLSILAVLTAVLLGLHTDGRGLSFAPRPGALELTSNLLLIQNLTYTPSIIGPLWSLPLEVQMYVALPFLFLWKKRSFGLLLGLWVVCGLLGHFPRSVPALAWFSLLIFVPNFLPGIMAFTLTEKRSIPSYLWPPFILILALVFLWMPTRRVGAELCLLLGMMLPRFKEITSRPLMLISHRIATYSYGIYLGHSFFIWFALRQLNSWILFWAMWLIIPALLYHAFEHPAIELGRRLAQKMSAAPHPVPSAEELSAEGFT